MLKHLFKFFFSILIVSLNLIYSNLVCAQVISGFSPSTIAAGQGQVLTINGLGFGTTTQSVKFTGNANGNLVQAIEFVSWTDSQILVRVPDGAGTGVIQVIVGGQTAASTNSLTVSYDIWNVIDTSVRQVGETHTGNSVSIIYQQFYKSYPYRLVNINNTGGYTFQFSPDFNANTSANQAFARALQTWKCATNVNWTIGNPTTINAVNQNDGISVIRFADPTEKLDDGVLSQTTITLGQTTVGYKPILDSVVSFGNFFQLVSNGIYEVNNIDISFASPSQVNWNFGPGPPSNTQIDFESVALHELGHALTLGHVNDVTDAMHATLNPGTTIRKLNANNITAGNYIMLISTTNANSFGYPPMIALTLPPGSCNSPVNADLASLAISKGSLTPVFASATTSYTAAADNTISSITITPTLSDPNATLTINGVTSGNGSASAALPLNVGNNAINIVVTAPDGITTKTYTINVNRALPADANLSSLAISNGTLTPVFASATTSYTASVVNTISSITITPTLNDPNATLTINGVTSASGIVSATLPLNVGSNTINVFVTAQDGTTTKTYTIKLNRALPPDADLSGLAISNGTLTPVFASATTSYTASVVNTISSITITPTLSDPNATLTINGLASASGNTSAALPLNVGSNTLSVVVTASGGTATKTYTVNVNRSLPSNADLSSLAISNGTLTPVFASATTGYTALADNTISSITITPTLSDPNATLTINGVTSASGSTSEVIPLYAGSNTITVIVTAQDGTTTKTYVIGIFSDNAVSPPTITAGTVTGRISSCAGTASASPNILQFTVSGSGLSANIIATAPTGFQVSLTAGSGYGSSVTCAQLGGIVSSTVVYVRSAASASGSISGNVTLTSTGATSQNLAVIGTVYALPTVNAVPNQTLVSGTATKPIYLTGQGNTINWVNNTPGIGLAANGTGDITSFTAINNGNSPVTATITTTPVAAGFAYIANWTTAGTVSVINTATNKVVNTISVDYYASGVAVSPDGNRAYVTNYLMNSVLVINTATNAVVSTISLGPSSSICCVPPSGPHGIVVSPDGSRLYVANGATNAPVVQVINTSTNAVIATIPQIFGLSALCVSPDGSRVYGANVIGFTVINTTNNTVITTIPLHGSVGVGVSVSGLSVTPDGSRLYVTNENSSNGTDAVFVINTTTNTVVSTITLISSGEGISVSPDGSRVYVANANSNNLSVINTATNSVTTNIPVGTSP